MREIVHIQAGQCGNQIGAKVRIVFIVFLVLNFFFSLAFYSLVLFNIVDHSYPGFGDSLLVPLFQDKYSLYRILLNILYINDLYKVFVQQNHIHNKSHRGSREK